MKKIILLFIGCAMFSLSSYAQHLFGSTHKDVRDTLLHNGYKYIQSKNANDGTIYDEYYDSDGMDIVCYFNGQEQCYQVRRFLKRSTLIDEIQYLNKTYIKVDKNNWVNKETTTKIYLKMPGDDDDYYSVSYVSMTTSEK